MIVGVAGCGAMGLPMAEALASASFVVRGLDVRPEAEFAEAVVPVRCDVGWFAEGAEVVISVVRDIPQTEALLFGDQSLIERATALKTLVISSTLAPVFLTDLRTRLPKRIALIDAPMSGAPVAARERRLSFMLGGNTAQIAPLMPLFDAMGRDIHHIGALGAGMTAKVLNNLVAASSTVATRLALEGAEAQGIDRKTMLAVLNSSSGQTWVSANFDRIDWIDQGFDPTNTMGILAKDVASGEAVCPQPEFGANLIAMLKKLTPLT